MKDHALRNCRQMDRRMTVEALVSVVESQPPFHNSARPPQVSIFSSFCCGEPGSASCSRCARTATPPLAHVWPSSPSIRRTAASKFSSQRRQRLEFLTNAIGLCVCCGSVVTHDRVAPITQFHSYPLRFVRLQADSGSGDSLLPSSSANV